MKRFFSKAKKIQDNRLHYHKPHCYLFNSDFTVIENWRGRKIWECNVKYCPCCGEKLR
jgi:hypothetical protein